MLSDGEIIQCPPFTYDDFISDPEWSRFDYSSDFAYDAVLRENDWADPTDFNDQFLDQGFQVLPLSYECRALLDEGVGAYGLLVFIALFKDIK